MDMIPCDVSKKSGWIWFLMIYSDFKSGWIWFLMIFLHHVFRLQVWVDFSVDTWVLFSESAKHWKSPHRDRLTLTSVAHVGKLWPSRASTSNSLLAISPTFQYANIFWEIWQYWCNEVNSIKIELQQWNNLNKLVWNWGNLLCLNKLDIHFIFQNLRIIC
jgi:hypothetical protein